MTSASLRNSGHAYPSSNSPVFFWPLAKATRLVDYEQFVQQPNANWSVEKGEESIPHLSSDTRMGVGGHKGIGGRSFLARRWLSQIIRFPR